MTKNEQWLNMLSILNIAPDVSIESGILVSRKLLSDNSTWRITLEFENLLPLEKIKFLTTEIKKYLVDNIGFEDVKFTIQYRTLTNNDNLLYEYFDDALEVLKEVRREILIIKKYPFKISNNEIRFTVATDVEKRVVESQCKIIGKYFANYILNVCSF